MDFREQVKFEYFASAGSQRSGADNTLHAYVFTSMSALHTINETAFVCINIILNKLIALVFIFYITQLYRYVYKFVVVLKKCDLRE